MEIKSDRKQRGTGKAVLVVDDNAVIRRILAAAFRSDGFTCSEAENGNEAIEIARGVSPDVITLDLSMPVMNGLEAASELRKLFPKTPIILFTLYADDLLKKDAFKSGVSLLLSKSEPVSTLVDKAHELISKS